MRHTPVLLVLLFSSILYSCQKNDPDNPGNTNNATDSVSSKKEINSVVFKVADNPSLAYDVSGLVNSDTVKVLFPPNTGIINLVPDISFLGKSISPGNKAAHDFTNPVTYIVTAEDGSTKQYIFSCSVGDSATMLLGKWSVVKDSSTNDGFVTSDGVYVNPGVYIGTSVDYWEFTSNGLLNIHENNQTGNGFKYTIKPNTRLYVDIISSGFDDGYILTLTPNNATFFWTKSNPNGKKYTRKVYLKK